MRVYGRKPQRENPGNVTWITVQPLKGQILEVQGTQGIRMYGYVGSSVTENPTNSSTSSPHQKTVHGEFDTYQTLNYGVEFSTSSDQRVTAPIKRL